ncbi:TetR/AcrR family transcriptional regulator [Nonomuraea gerenzanensis]|uniref:Transcriptional regulator, TetR family n=1 Tax=Nonomuraea gerenzanensis TaxID=93944 RepID=A0A1M4E4Q2_9ACTN|nr:TetR/AcrR family transcriptional regulator [Nonomuraea gerenzanensis]UBU16006.1 TetR/AcrR family transcriptional regulator [Nonomuraea gerenzanensis]SBO93806.1 Transcriptional regulator, TetR family [Nonomuraea gerenzanensis]
MARPREFDEQDVVARATELFWRRGYTATGVRELGAELELKQSSLYRTFHDKRGLFLRALDHYRATESSQAGELLERPGPVRDVLREWLTCMVGDETGRGCLVVNTATELGATDAEVRRRTEAAFDVTRKALESLLRRGCRTGELPSALDLDAAVDLLFTTVLGLRVRERAGHDPERLAATIDYAVRMLAAP